MRIIRLENTKRKACAPRSPLSPHPVGQRHALVASWPGSTRKFTQTRRFADGANGYDAAVWTALASNFEEQGGEPFSVTAALKYLEALEDEDAAAFASALVYIQRAPREVETPVREKVAKRWPS